MVKRGEDDKKGETEKQTFSDKLVEKFYRDHDIYDWSGKMVEKGSEARRKGSDGP